MTFYINPYWKDAMRRTWRANVRTAWDIIGPLVASFAITGTIAFLFGWYVVGRVMMTITQIYQGL